MKTIKISTRLFLFSILSILFTNSFAGNYTWTGNTSTSWTTTTNWSPNGNPSTNDTVKITTGTNNCLMAANTTVKKFTMTMDTIDFNGFTLTVSTDVSISGGFATNGTLVSQSGSSVSFSGGTISTTVNVNGTNILFDGAKFNNPVTAIFKGSGTSTGRGGNVFNSTVTLTDSGTGFWTFANTTADTANDLFTVTNTTSGTIYLAHNTTNNFFKKATTISNTSSGTVNCAYYRTATFNDSLILNCTGSSGAIRFGKGGGSVTASGYIGIGSSGLSSSSTIEFQGVHQADHSQNISLTGTGTSAISFGHGCEFEGNVTASAPALSLDGTTFDKKAILTHTGNLTTTCFGGCTFKDSTWIYHSNSTSGTFLIASSSTDNYNAPVVIENSDKGKIAIARATFLDAATFSNHSPSASSGGGVTSTVSDDYTFVIGDAHTCSFSKAVTLYCDSGGIGFGTSHGHVDFHAATSLNIDSSYYGKLLFSNTNYSGSSIHIPFDGNSEVLYLDSNNTFDAPVFCNVRRVQLNGSTFNDSLILKTTGLDSDTSKGGNVFNGLTMLTDSNVTASKVMVLAKTYSDDFNGRVIFKQYSKGKIYPSHTKNSTFSGDIAFDGDSTIYFGVGGGRVVLDGASTPELDKIGTNQISIKKLELKKTGGEFELGAPMTVTDSVIFTKGFMTADSTRPLIISDNGIVSGASDSSFVIGLVKKVGNDAFTFPLGNVEDESAFYHPLSLSAPSNATDAFTAEYIYGSHGLSTNADSTIENESLCEYWKVNRLVGSSKVKVGLGWNSNSCNVYGLDSMRVAAWDTASLKWKDRGNASTTGNLTIGTVVSVDSISKFGSVITLADKFCTSLISIATKTEIRCHDGTNGSVHLSVTGATPPYGYSWNNNKGIDSYIVNLDSGNYIYTLIDSRGCTKIDTITFINPPLIQISTTTTSSACGDSTGTAIAVATGGTGTIKYEWAPETILNDTAANLSSGIHSILVTDSLGCKNSEEVYISDTNGAVASMAILTHASCYSFNDGSAEINVTSGSGPYLYYWISTNDSDTVSYTLRAGIQYAEIIDAEGCITFVSDTIEQPNEILVSLAVTNSQCGDSTGSIEATVSGGSGSFDYAWSTGGTEYIEDSIPSGIDTLIVTDTNGCMVKQFARVLDSDGPSLTTHIISHVTCFGGDNGSAYVSVSGGTAPYTYEWTPYQIEAIITDSSDTVITTIITDDTLINSKAGDFTVTVIDSNGCIQQESITILEPPRLIVTAYAALPSNDSTSDGSMNLLAEGGTKPYTFLWLPDSSTSKSISNLGIGEIIFIVTDDVGCEFTDSMNMRSVETVTANTCPYNTPYAIRPDPVYCIEDPCGSPWTCDYMYITDFGAIPNDGLSDECAFEAANQYIMDHICGFTPTVSTGFTLFFPAGTYIVGRQNPIGGQYLRGHHVICLDQCHVPITLEGELGPGNIQLAFIEFEECMKYGAFDPTTGDRYIKCTTHCATCPGGNMATTHGDYAYAAYPGNFLNISNSNDFTIKNLAINGNLDNMEIGGYFASDLAGINLPHSGISIFSCTDLKIDNVICSVFGQDGVNISDFAQNGTYRSNRISLNRVNCSLNGRSGVSWVGGSDVTFKYCDFFYNALGRIHTNMASGIDIEWESGNSVMNDGFFLKCRFISNLFCGVICDNDHTHAWTSYTKDFLFRRCTFVASQYGNSVWANGQSMSFGRCDFYGHVIHAYNAMGYPSNIGTKFISSTFHEEYPNGFSYNLDNCDECGTAITCTSHPWEIEFFVAANAGFFDCDMYTNKQSRIIFMQGTGADPATMNGCNLTNYGLSNMNDLGTMYDVSITNSYFFPVSWGYFFAGNSPSPGGLVSNEICKPKYVDISYPDRVNLFSTIACTIPYYVTLSPYCPPTSPRLAFNKNETINLSTKVVYPNPAMEKINILNLSIGDIVTIMDTQGRIVYTYKTRSILEDINISFLAPGFYILEVNGKESNKFLKQ